MANTIEKIRNIGLFSHSAAGKTSLLEAMLFKAGAVTRQGQVEEGNTVSDYDPEEIERKISISTTAAHCDWKGHRVNIIDTPGYADFIGEVLGAVPAIDAGLLLVCGVNGPEVGTSKGWDLLEERNLSRLIFVNKLDKENSDFNSAVEQIRETFGKKCAPIQYPVGREAGFESVVDLTNEESLGKLSGDDAEKAGILREQLIETVAESDDNLIEKYLEVGSLTPEEMKTGLAQAIKSGSLIPILCGSALKSIGVEEILDIISADLPAPCDRNDIKAQDPKTEEELTIKPDVSEPLSAFVFKTISDPYVGQLTLFRVFSGQLMSNGEFYNSTKEQKERIGQLYYMQGKEQVATDKVQAGDIAGVAKLKKTATGDSICESRKPVLYPSIVLPEAAISFSIKPKARADEDKIGPALAKLSAEDNAFRAYRDPQTKEQIVGGMGDLHLDIMIKRLKRNFNVEVEVGTPKVPYKETIRKKAKAQGRYKKQSGGRGQYGDAWLELEPLPHGSGFEFEDRIVGGVIPRQYIPAVQKGVVESMVKGILAGYPVVDIKVGVYDGSYHNVDSSEMAFKIAAGMGFRSAFMDASPVLLEPIMDVEIIIPEDFMGEITGNLNSRRGRVMGMDTAGRNQLVKASAPLSEMFKYANELRSMTGGQGSYTMKFSHYEEVPAKVQEEIIAKAKQAKEESK